MLDICLYLCNILCKQSLNRKINLNKTTMKALSTFNEIARCNNYEAPTIEVVDVAVERGFEASNEAGFEGPSYGEEDVEW